MKISSTFLLTNVKLRAKYDATPFLSKEIFLFIIIPKFESFS